MLFAEPIAQRNMFDKSRGQFAEQGRVFSVHLNHKLTYQGSNFLVLVDRHQAPDIAWTCQLVLLLLL